MNNSPTTPAISTNPKLKKIVAAVARERSGKVIDLVQIEGDVRIAILQRAIEQIWEDLDRYDLDPGLVEIADRLLPDLERMLHEEIISRLIAGDPREEHARLARHCAARGVRKVRGAK
jgi:hypothetical protein